MLAFVNSFFISRFLSLSTPAKHEIRRSLILRRRFVEHRRIQQERWNMFKKRRSKNFSLYLKTRGDKGVIPALILSKVVYQKVRYEHTFWMKCFLFLIFPDPRQKQQLYKVDHTRAGDQQVLVFLSLCFLYDVMAACFCPKIIPRELCDRLRFISSDKRIITKRTKNKTKQKTKKKPSRNRLGRAKKYSFTWDNLLFN